MVFVLILMLPVWILGAGVAAVAAAQRARDKDCTAHITMSGSPAAVAGSRTEHWLSVLRRGDAPGALASARAMDKAEGGHKFEIELIMHLACGAPELFRKMPGIMIPPAIVAMRKEGLSTSRIESVLPPFVEVEPAPELSFEQRIGEHLWRAIATFSDTGRKARVFWLEGRRKAPSKWDTTIIASGGVNSLEQATKELEKQRQRLRHLMIFTVAELSDWRHEVVAKIASEVRPYVERGGFAAYIRTRLREIDHWSGGTGGDDEVWTTGAFIHYDEFEDVWRTETWRVELDVTGHPSPPPPESQRTHGTIDSEEDLVALIEHVQSQRARRMLESAFVGGIFEGLIELELAGVVGEDLNSVADYLVSYTESEGGDALDRETIIDILTDLSYEIAEIVDRQLDEGVNPWAPQEFTTEVDIGTTRLNVSVGRSRTFRVPLALAEAWAEYATAELAVLVEDYGDQVLEDEPALAQDYYAELADWTGNELRRRR